MKKPTRDPTEPQELRRMAEVACKSSPTDDSELRPENFPSILQELRIHQVELEIQNEELRRTREELEESRDLYFDLYDQAPVGYLTTDAKGRILQANLTASSMLGLPRGNLVGQSLYLFAARDHHTAMLDLLKLGAEDRGKQTLAIEMIRKDGSRFHAQLESAPQLDNDDLPMQFRMAIVDVTERKRTEYQLSQSEERYRRLVETMPDGVFTLLPDGLLLL